MPRRIATSATRLPILPRPIRPSVWPGSSAPANCFLPSSIFFSRSAESFCEETNSSAGARLRAAISIPASTSSFTAFALAPGALKTGTPRLESAGTGMLLTPAPARPTALSDAPNSNLCRSAERTRIAVGSFASFSIRYFSEGRRFKPTCAIWLMTSTSHFFARGLAMLRFEFLHVADQRAQALDRHGVVDRRAHPAHRAVALQLDHAPLGRALQEFLIELRILEREGHVHARAVLLRHRVVEQGAPIQVVVKQPGLFDILDFDRR